MDDVSSLFAPLVGLSAWSVRRGVGTYLILEFGAPHMLVREPTEPKRAISKRVIALLKRRRVFIEGQWHLWIQDCDWEVSAGGQTATSGGSGNAAIDRVLAGLDGEKLTGASRDGPDGTATFTFDLGGRIRVAPPRHKPPMDDQWSLDVKDGPTTRMLPDGRLAADVAPG